MSQGMSFAALAARNASNPAPASAPLPASNIAAAAPAPPATMVDAEPSEARTLFARGVIYIFDTWSVLQAAINEEWGGPESQDKADYLLNAVVDYFDDFSAPAEAALAQSSATATVEAPDQDDVWDILDGYLAAEYDASVEDESTLNVARRMIDLWKQVFLPPSPGTAALQQAQETVNTLQRVRDQVKGTKTVVTRGDDEAGWSDSDDEDEEDQNLTSAHDHQHDSKLEPEVDEDGFTTVPNRRRK